MKTKHIFLLLYLFLMSISASYASNDYYYGLHPKLECTITPNFSEMPSGETASFTITLRNKSDKSVKIDYSTGQEWDLVIIHNKKQIYRWSSGFKWEEKPFSNMLKPGKSISATLPWKAVSKYGMPVSQGDFVARGIAMIEPKHLVSSDYKFRVFPPSIVKQEFFKVKLNRLFEVKIPAHNDTDELRWRIEFTHNRNQLGIRNIKRDKENVTILMHPKRYGFVEFNLYACPMKYRENKSVEKRKYRIEITDLDD